MINEKIKNLFSFPSPCSCIYYKQVYSLLIPPNIIKSTISFFLNLWVPKMTSTSPKMIRVLFFLGRNRRNAQTHGISPVELQTDFFMEVIKKRRRKIKYFSPPFLFQGVIIRSLFKINNRNQPLSPLRWRHLHSPQFLLHQLQSLSGHRSYCGLRLKL